MKRYYLLAGMLATQLSAQIGGAGYVASSIELSFCSLGSSAQVQGNSSAGIGDLDGDGIADLATQWPSNQDVVAIHFLTAAGTIRETALFGQGGLGGFVGDIAELERFSDELASLGDLDGDGVVDMLVGQDQDDDGPGNPGAAWVVFLNPDGTVKNQQKISAEVGGLTIPPKNAQKFGKGLATIGDLNGDGIQDIAVGAPGNILLGRGGVVHILMMNRDGTVLSQSIIGVLDTPLGDQIPAGNSFGESIASIGDLDGDGVFDIAVGAPGPVLTDVGSVWVVFLTPSGGVKGFTQITEGTPGFGADLDVLNQFGWETTGLGDLNGDGFPDIAVSANAADTAGQDKGEIYIIFLDGAGGVLDWILISEGLGGFEANLLSLGAGFGTSMDVLSGLGSSDDLVLSVGCSVACPFPFGAQFLLTLDDGQRAISYPYGNSVNPPGSLQVLSGVPSTGTTMQVGIDNPLGTQNPGGVPFLVLSLQPDPNFPNGTALPGFGMAGGGASGELLLSLSPIDLLPPALLGPAWAGTGQASAIDLAVPADASLLGLLVFCQGVLPDPTADQSSVRFGLTTGLQLRIGL